MIAGEEPAPQTHVQTETKRLRTHSPLHVYTRLHKHTGTTPIFNFNVVYIKLYRVILDPLLTIDYVCCDCRKNTVFLSMHAFLLLCHLSPSQPGCVSAADSMSPSPAPAPWPVVSAPPAAVGSPPPGAAWPSAAPCAPAAPPLLSIKQDRG